MSLYSRVFDHVLRRVDAERAHTVSFAALRALVAVPGGTALVRRVCRVPEAPVTAFGVQFANPFGLAAGFDKDARGIEALGALGFGFVEVGTVTALPQPGNPRPRLFRLPADRAVVNRMGFNNEGAAAAASRLKRWRARTSRHRGGLRVGINLGKSKLTPGAEAVADYVTSADLVAPYADYLVVNVSSPNTPGLRDLQAIDVLRPLLAAVRAAAQKAAGRHVPLLVKIAPDLADADIEALAHLVREMKLDGIVATNTTVSRDGLASLAAEVEAAGSGGLSGAPLRARSLAVLQLLRRDVPADVAIISVGGIDTAEDAIARLDAGATLVQAYTGLVHGGPRWPQGVVTAIAERQRMRKDPHRVIAGDEDT